MAKTNTSEPRIDALGALRCAGMAVAMAEMVYLVFWIGLAFRPGADGTLNSLAGLGRGMAWSALFGAVAGLTIATSFNLIGDRILQRAARRFR